MCVCVCVCVCVTQPDEPVSTLYLEGSKLGLVFSCVLFLLLKSCYRWGENSLKATSAFICCSCLGLFSTCHLLRGRDRFFLAPVARLIGRMFSKSAEQKEWAAICVTRVILGCDVTEKVACWEGCQVYFLWWEKKRS